MIISPSKNFPILSKPEIITYQNTDIQLLFFFQRLHQCFAEVKTFLLWSNDEGLKTKVLFLKTTSSQDKEFCFNDKEMVERVMNV